MQLLRGVVACLLLEVFEVGTAECTAQPIKVEVHVIAPVIIERFQEITADRAPFETTQAPVLPDRAEHGVGVVKIGQGVARGVSSRLPRLQFGPDAFGKLLESAVLGDGHVILTDTGDVGNRLVAKVAVEDHFENHQVAEVE